MFVGTGGTAGEYSGLLARSMLEATTLDMSPSIPVHQIGFAMRVCRLFLGILRSVNLGFDSSDR